MILTSLIFEKEIINYTHLDDYMLDEITTSISYESNLEEVEKIMLSSLHIHMRKSCLEKKTDYH